MATSQEDARKELDDEFESVRKGLRKIQEELDEVSKLGPEDDLYDRIGDLEDVVKKVRTGGLIGGGAKGHRKALAQYRDAKDG